MIRFAQFLTEFYIANPMPIVYRSEKIIQSLKNKVLKKNGEVRTIMSWELANSGKLTATKSMLFQEMDDNIFPDIKYPVVVQYKGVGHIIDGHLIIAHDLINKLPTDVYWVK